MTTVFDVIEKEINEKMELVSEAILSNRPTKMEEYRYMTGQLNGLAAALSYVKALRVKVNNDEDLE